MAEAIAEGAAAPESAANRASFERYLETLREGMERPAVTDPRLGALLDDLYRPGATVGSGSTAAAVRAERAAGIAVGGRFHTQKASDYVSALERWLANNPGARLADRAAAENVLRDLRSALGR